MKISSIRGIGKASFMVTLFNFLKLTHIRFDLSGLGTNKIGAAHALECRIIPACNKASTSSSIILFSYWDLRYGLIAIGLCPIVSITCSPSVHGICNSWTEVAKTSLYSSYIVNSFILVCLSRVSTGKNSSFVDFSGQ